MRSRFTVCFRAKDHDGVLGEAVLDVELPFAPTPEIQFEHPAWGEARKPTLVIFDLQPFSNQLAPMLAVTATTGRPSD